MFYVGALTTDREVAVTLTIIMDLAVDVGVVGEAGGHEHAPAGALGGVGVVVLVALAAPVYLIRCSKMRTWRRSSSKLLLVSLEIWMARKSVMNLLKMR